MRKAFTLIELLVVISIIGVLIALSVFGLQGARESSRDTKRKSDLEVIRSALELYKADCNVYPPALPAVGAQLIGTGTASCPANVYLEARPGDPLPDRSYVYSLTGTGYTLTATLESCTVPACTYRVTNP